MLLQFTATCALPRLVVRYAETQLQEKCILGTLIRKGSNTPEKALRSGPPSDRKTALAPGIRPEKAGD
jgi:hypothetical protein